MRAEAIDVLVLGLGPAGARAAQAAARRGCRVVALDRRRVAGLPVQCAEFVPGLVGIEVAGLARSVRQSIAAMHTHVEGDAPERSEPFPGRMLDRAIFDANLVDEARGAGADCRFGARVREIGSDGRVLLADGTRWAPRVIVGADGARSLAGRSIGQVNTSLVETRQVSVVLERAHDATDVFLSARIPGGYGWLFPKGDVAHVGAGVVPERRAELKSIVNGLHAALLARGRVGGEILARTGGAIPVGGMLKPWGTLDDALVLLAGDAAGLANPITGAGIASAVHSGRLAGEAAACSVDGERSACLDYEDELDDLFGAALSRAVHRRRELLASSADKRALRRAWIAYPEYWGKTGDRPLFPLAAGADSLLGNRGLSPVFPPP